MQADGTDEPRVVNCDADMNYRRHRPTEIEYVQTVAFPKQLAFVVIEQVPMAG
jgi:hypothetical protein